MSTTRFMPIPARRLGCLGVALAAGWLLSACGGGSSTATPAETSAALRATAGSGELVAHVRQLLRQRQAALQASPTALFDRYATPALAATAGATAATGTTAAPLSSSTLVQEAGVDETDVLKADGSLVFALDAYSLNQTSAGQLQLQVVRARQDGQLDRLQALPLPAADPASLAHGLLLASGPRRLVSLSEHLSPVGAPVPCSPLQPCLAADSLIFPPWAMRASLQVQAADYAADGRTTLGTRLTIDGRLVGSRRIGNTVLLVTTHTPQLAVEQLPATATAAEREAALAALRAADLLPQLRVDGGPAQPLVAETDCYVQPTSTSLSVTVTTLVAIDLSSAALPRQTRCFLGGTDALYLSTDNLYLATTRNPAPTVLPDGRLRYTDSFVTDIHRFAFTDGTPRYRASGEVAGHLGWEPLRMALRMSEFGGDLRVLSFTGSTGWVTASDADAAMAPSPATLTVLREDPSSARLRSVATLPNAQRPQALGKPGEQVYGVRFVGPRAYVVTFRTVDPLYVLDLSNPLDPRQAAALELPGFSDVLVPLGDGLLFGAGRDASTAGTVGGVKLALFDVSDPTSPVVRGTQVLGGRGSFSALDFNLHGLNLLALESSWRLALPMALVDPGSGAATHALHRFEVGGAPISLRVSAPALDAPSSLSPWDLSADRSVQIGSTVVWLTQGRLLSTLW